MRHREYDSRLEKSLGELAARSHAGTEGLAFELSDGNWYVLRPRGKTIPCSFNAFIGYAYLGILEYTDAGWTGVKNADEMGRIVISWYG